MSSSGKKPLGRILLEQQVINKAKLDSFLARQKQSGERLGSIIDKEVPEKHGSLLRALSIQHGVPAINLDEIVINLDILRLVPQEVAVKNSILPILEKEEHLFLAMSDPQSHNVVDEIEFVTGKKVFRYVTLDHSVAKAIEECYLMREEGKPFYRGKEVSGEKYDRLMASLGRKEEQPLPSESGHEALDPEPAPDLRAEPEKVEESSEESLPMAEDLFQSESLEMSVTPALTSELEQEQDIDPGFQDEIPIEVETERKGTRILVVDDEEDILNLISKVLIESNYNVITATAGREALAIVKREPLDLIILDAMLPEIHGFDICRRIKGSSKYGHIPVIMISAIYRGWRFARDLKESYGVDEFIEKPFKIQGLLRSVENMLQRKSSLPSESKEEMSREAQRHLEISAKAYREGDFNSAIEHLKASVKIDSLSQKLHYNLALVYGKAGLVYYAISELETVLELEPTMFQAMKNLAILYQEAGFKNKAIEMWERALSICKDEESKKKMREHLMSML